MPGTTWANEMNIGLNHAPGAGLIALPVDLHSNLLWLHPTRTIDYHYYETIRTRITISHQSIYSVKAKTWVKADTLK